jgi:hypothetical protein
MATVHYRIDYAKVNGIGRKRARRVMSLVVAECRIVARRNVMWGKYTRTGRLAQSIYGTLRTTPEGFVGRVGSRLSYAASVEGGARRHYIKPRDANGWLVFFWEREGRVVKTKRVNHPGQRGKHYLRDALIRVGARRGFRVVIHD